MAPEYLAGDTGRQRVLFNAFMYHCAKYVAPRLVRDLAQNLEAAGPLATELPLVLEDGEDNGDKD